MIIWKLHNHTVQVKTHCLLGTCGIVWWRNLDQITANKVQSTTTTDYFQTLHAKKAARVFKGAAKHITADDVEL